ncbi:MAG: RNA 2',3'-cyclic phosphodiesterase [Acidobacteria bacterium]|nr:RNA 2',3'-cyclic phosphodiesterase [Acidobacteriota bacterium]
MKERIRSFVAVALPEELLQRLAELSSQLRRLRLDGSFPRPESIHLTLKFLGEVERKSLSRIEDGLQQCVSDICPFELIPGALGAFPDLKHPRVVWMGFQPSPSLQHLHERVEKALTREGFAAENREFRPHLTLARLKSSRNVAGFQNFLREHTSERRQGVVPVAEIKLYQSTLKPEGAQYHVLASFPLRGKPEGPLASQ